MQAAVVYEYGVPIVVADVDVSDELGPHDVRVGMRASGLCHSDLSAQTGALPFPLPIILGHEGSGVIEAVGESVSTVAVGDHVVLSALIHCGACENCLKGRPNLCVWGLETIFSCANPDTAHARGAFRAVDGDGNGLHQFSSIGTLADVLVCNERHAVPIPTDVPFEAACLAGCGVLTGMSAVLNRARVEAGSSVVVIGCGGVGLNVVQTAALVGAGTIIAVDVHPSKLELARGFGATHAVQGGEGVAEEVFAITGAGADYVFEVVGVPELVTQAWSCLRIDGTLVAVGVHPADAVAELPALDFATSEKTLMSCLYGSSRPTKDIPLAIDLYRQGRYKLDELVSHRFELGDVNRAVEGMHGGAGARSVVLFD